MEHLTPEDVNGFPAAVVTGSAGGYHTCTLSAGGGVSCWGSNTAGQLGDGTRTSRWIPADVNGLTAGVQAIAAGVFHTCGLTTTGGVKCWGRNGYGQVGDGATEDRLTPVDVNGLTAGVQAVDAGREHTCAVTMRGGVKCWGRNEQGQLGDGAREMRLTPVDVAGLTSGVQALASTGSHDCVLTVMGGVKCWGANLSGQLGDNTWEYRAMPVDVVGLTDGVQAVVAGYLHTCAVTKVGGVKCWGYDGEGQVGVNPGWVPVDVVFQPNPAVYLPFVQ